MPQPPKKVPVVNKRPEKPIRSRSKDNDKGDRAGSRRDRSSSRPTDNGRKASSSRLTDNGRDASSLRLTDSGRRIILKTDRQW